MTEPVTAELLVDVQRRLEALYALEPQAPVTDFLMAEEDAAGLPGGGSRTLVRHDGDDLSLGVVLEAAVRAHLARRDPRVLLDDSNLGSFCTLTEEVSHFVYLLFCARSERSVTQLELELQGEVDKYLAVAFLLSQQNDGAVSVRLREMLFRHYRLDRRAHARAGGAVPRGQRAGVPLLRLAGEALPAPARRPRRPGARGAPVLPSRPAAEAGADRRPAITRKRPGSARAPPRRPRGRFLCENPRPAAVRPAVFR